MRRILLADDEAAPSEIIRYFIREHRLPLEVVGETRDGPSTMEAILRLKPDIVFLDIEMPGMNGLEVMEKVHREHPEIRCDFILITAFDDFSYARQALRMGAGDYLLKPVMYPQFEEALQRVLGYRYTESPDLNNILEYLDAHFAEDLRLQDAAAATAMSESNVSRLFKKYLDTSFISYLNDLRMRKAMAFLDRGQTIQQASENAGYNNLSYFYRVFRAKFGMTPREYLEKQKA